MRKILGVFAGYVVMLAFFMITLTAAWVGLGESFAFREGTHEATVGWMAVHLPLTFLGAIIGGWIAAMIGRDSLSVKMLAGVLLVFGLWTAIAQLGVDPAPANQQAAEQPTPPPEQDPSDRLGTRAAARMVHPTWYNFALPFFSLVGVLIGGLGFGGLDIPD